MHATLLLLYAKNIQKSLSLVALFLVSWVHSYDGGLQHVYCMHSNKSCCEAEDFQQQSEITSKTMGKWIFFSVVFCENLFHSSDSFFSLAEIIIKLELARDLQSHFSLDRLDMKSEKKNRALNNFSSMQRDLSEKIFNAIEKLSQIVSMS